MICWTLKLSSVTVKSVILPSFVPFLVSTLRPLRLKLRAIIFSILTTSPSEISSSAESITRPNLEYSRTLLVSKILPPSLFVAP